MTGRAGSLGGWVVFAVVEVLLYASYRSHDARFHWMTHFLVAGTVALAAMGVWSYATRRPARRHALWILGAHLYAMFPDFVFEAGHRHEWWMEVFLLHIRSHLVPGRNLFWLVTFLVALAAYLTVLDHRVRRKPM